MRLPSHPRCPPVPRSLVRVGLAGWAYRDWQGIVYPAPPSRGFDRLDWIARFTDLVEINATFYRAARPRDAERWARTVERYPDFRFTAKLEKIFTHDAEGAGDAAERRYRDGLAPLVESGRLAAVLIQFPYSFHNIAANRRRLARLLNRFSDYPLTVEFRHRGWLTADLLAFLASRQVTLAGVDQPAVGQSVPPSLPLTGPFFYIRLHGRNTADWFRPDAGRDARYNYLYDHDDLRPWVQRIRDAAAENLPGLVVGNNHFRGQAAVNAVEIRAALAGHPVPAPAELIRAYPRLAAVARPLPSAGGANRRLF
ncbi:MAG: DUF72 domain-containing protein [Acidobacteria bacterium]|nr:DUF72 domain-containing protein [Acidobacteriota bacterium]